MRVYCYQIFLCSFLFICLSTASYGQDHYWSQQYGGPATLTGGTAVVGANDHSGLFYNPGALGFIDSVQVTASTFAFGFESMKLKNGAGNDLNLTGFRVNILPQLIATSINIKKAPKLKLVLGTLTRSRINIRLNQENENLYDVIKGAPGLEYYKARGEFSNSSVEQWSGIGLAYQFNKNWSAGLSAFGSFTSMQVRSVENLNAEVTKNAVPYVATVNQYNAMSLNQVTQVFKIGAAGHFKHWQLGLAVTLPGIKIWGEGKLDKSFEAYNLNKNPVDTNIPAQKYPEFIISDLQRGLQSHYKIPLSATAGLKLIYPKFALSASFEYFLGYKNRTILQGQDRTAIRPTAFYGNDTIHGFMQIQTSANHVLNIGLGAEVKVQPKWTLLLGFRTDFSNRTDYLPNNSVVNAPSAGSPTWHYLYFSSGFTYRLAYHNLTLGIDYGVAVSANKQQIYNFTEPQQDNFLLGALHQNMRASVHKPNLILTYIYFLKTKGKRTVTMSILDELKKAQIKKEKPTRKKKK